MKENGVVLIKANYLSNNNEAHLHKNLSDETSKKKGETNGRAAKGKLRVQLAGCAMHRGPARTSVLGGRSRGLASESATTTTAIRGSSGTSDTSEE
jgi:hypothetical protein